MQIIYCLLISALISALYSLSSGQDYLGFASITLIVFLIINAILVLFVYLVGVFSQKNPRNKFALATLQFACKYILNFMGIRLVEIKNINFPDRPFVLVGNHQSAFDIILIFSKYAKFGIGAIAKIELMKYPFVKEWLKSTNSIAIDRANPRKAVEAVVNGSKQVEDGQPMLIFPEGTRTRQKDGSLLEFKPGAFKLATKAKADIYPFCVHNLYKINKIPFVPKKVYITYLKPLTYDEYKDLNTNEIAEIIRERINNEFEKKGYN